MCCSNILACLVIIVGIAAAIMCIVGLAIPVWNTVDATSTTGAAVNVKVTVYEGLWQRCTSRELQDDAFSCDQLSGGDYTSGKKAALAMVLIGVVFIIVCVVLMALHMTLCSLVEILTKIAAGAAFLASLFIIIGVIVYGAKVHDDLGGDLSAGFGLCLTSALLCIAIGVVCVLAD